MTALRLLVLGGARSGKSRHAQARAEALPGELVYVATAQAFDGEMEERIARHRSDRGARWRTVEAPLELAEALSRNGKAGSVLLVDCLTLWTSNLMLAGHDIERETGQLLTAIKASASHIILVANEVGLGIVPDNALARQFRDEVGRMNQAIAAAASEVVFVAAGLALGLK